MAGSRLPDRHKTQDSVSATAAESCRPQQIWENAVLAVGEEQQVIMVYGPQHARFRANHLPSFPGQRIGQPKDAGSLSAVYTALAFILAREPAARVIIIAEKPVISPAETFTELTRHAFQLAADFPDQLFLAGAAPNDLQMHNDWIEWWSDQPEGGTGSGVNGITGQGIKCADPSTESQHPTLKITSIHNNPGLKRKKRLFCRGALWNANIVVAQARLLWSLLNKRSPDLFERFAYINNVISHFGTDRQSKDYIHSAISHAFYEIPTRDFAKEIIKPHLQQCRVIPMQDVAIRPVVTGRSDGNNRSGNPDFVKNHD